MAVQIGEVFAIAGGRHWHVGIFDDAPILDNIRQAKAGMKLAFGYSAQQLRLTPDGLDALAYVFGMRREELIPGTLYGMEIVAQSNVGGSHGAIAG